MQVKILSTFLDGYDRYIAGDTRTIDSADAARFIKAGWVSAVDVPAEPDATTTATNLAVADLDHSTGVDNHG
ncbi:MAG: hypothetical protein QMD17_13965 [Rhodocyclaceae bacterium]|nr:hypothetical protein [Rhodocyclaceae bacterium]